MALDLILLPVTGCALLLSMCAMRFGLSRQHLSIFAFSPTGDAGAECRCHCCEAELWGLQDHPLVQHPTTEAGGGEYTGEMRKAAEPLFQNQRGGGGELVRCGPCVGEC